MPPATRDARTRQDAWTRRDASSATQGYPRATPRRPLPTAAPSAILAMARPTAARRIARRARASVQGRARARGPRARRAATVAADCASPGAARPRANAWPSAAPKATHARVPATAARSRATSELVEGRNARRRDRTAPPTRSAVRIVATPRKATNARSTRSRRAVLPAKIARRAVGAPCCGVCDDSVKRCDPDTGSACRAIGTICERDAGCCHGTCTDDGTGRRVCTSPLLADGLSCQAGFECKNGSCAGNPPSCGSAVPACIPPGAPCTSSGRCCSGLCGAGGTCQAGCVPSGR